MRNIGWIVIVVVVAGLLAGCGNVYLKGDALTAAETAATARNPQVAGFQQLFKLRGRN